MKSPQIPLKRPQSELAAKLDSTKRIFDAVATQFRAPVVAWSSGKDSMVLLAVARQRWPQIPVIFFRQHQLPHKTKWATELAASWNLSVFDWPPAQTGVREGNGHLDLVSRYSVGTAMLDVSLSLYEPTEGESLCAFWDLIVNRVRTPEVTLPWDVILLGSKASDKDKTVSQTSFTAEITVGPVGSPSIAFPLRDWTDEDVWNYSHQYGVPQNTARYAGDRSANSDDYPACYRCLVQGVDEVDCPRLGVRIKSNAALVHHFPWPGISPTR